MDTIGDGEVFFAMAWLPSSSTIAYTAGSESTLILHEVSDGTFASIGGLLWQDLNADGLQTGEESNGIPGVTVNLYDAADTQEVIPPAGFTFTVPDVGADDTIDSDFNVSTGRIEGVTLAVGDNLTDLDGGLVPAR